jgi:predicted transcriptional regulator
MKKIEEAVNRNEKPTAREIQSAKIRTRIVDKLVRPSIINADDIKSSMQTRQRAETLKKTLRDRRVKTLLKKASKYAKNHVQTNPTLTDTTGRQQ